MAKKNKAQKTGGPQGAKPAKEVPPLVKAIDEHFERGNFAGVRKVAERVVELDEESRRHVEELVEKTKTDPHAWLIGAGAVLLVLIVGAITLTT